MSNQGQIVRVNIWRVAVPYLQEWIGSNHVFAPYLDRDERLIMQVIDDRGLEGWSETSKLADDQTIQAIARRLLDLPLTAHRMGLHRLHDPGWTDWDRPAPPSPHAPPHHKLRNRLRHPQQHMVEAALFDVIARRAGVPLCQLYGGPWRDRIAVDYWMARTTPEDTVRFIRRGRELGFHGVKLKATLEDPNVERLEAIKQEAPDWKVNIDPNERFYQFDDAWPQIRELDRVGNLSILEDPFHRFHLQDFVRLRPRINARVVVHIDPPESIGMVIASGAAGGLNIDSHTQGLTGWLACAAAAHAANLPIWHGNGLDLGISNAHQLHLAAAAPNCTLPGDQIGPWFREHDLLTKRYVVENGSIAVPMGDGIGVEVDLNALEKYTVKKHQGKKISKKAIDKPPLTPPVTPRRRR